MAETKPTSVKLDSFHDKLAKRSYPRAFLAKGATAPNKGSNMTIDPGNGVIYQGKVTDVVTADGESMVEFAEGLKPVKAE